MRESHDLKGGTLDEMLNSGERKLVESTSSRKTGHQGEGWGCHPTVNNSDPELFLSKKIAGTTMENRLRERKLSDQPNQDGREAPRPDTTTDGMVCLQVGAQPGCPLRCPTSS